jgi:hypothetical protein
MDIDIITYGAILLALMGFGLIIMLAIFYFGFLKKKECSYS